LRKALSLLDDHAELLRRARAWFSRLWRDKVEKRLYHEIPLDFGPDGERLNDTVDCPVLRIEGRGKLNEPESVEWIRGQAPDLIVVCGASLLNEDILDLPRYGVLNLHGGLSQFYRGLFTTDWAIHNKHPEYVGATVHVVSPGIDDGAVVFQGRPLLSPDDHPNKCYEKVVRLGVDMMSQAISAIDRQELHKPETPTKGHLYRYRDFTPAVKRRLWRSWRQSMAEYDRQRESRDRAVNASLIHPFQSRRRQVLPRRKPSKPMEAEA
jgi:folate-dependent phosphoribosylglycinamide formyltransferase PurN